MAECTELKKVFYTHNSMIHGSCTGNIPIFILQFMGYEVSTVFGCQYTNSPAYGEFSCVGEISAEDIGNIYQTLNKNNLLNYTYVATGYISPKIANIEKWVDIIQDLKAKNPDLCYVCDPLFGDHGRPYVTPDIIDLYKKKLIPLANIITPNDFELEKLTDISIKAEPDALKACNLLHDRGVDIVFLTSMRSQDEDKYISLVSRARGGRKEVYRTEFPKIPQFFHGPGDTLMALFLGWIGRDGVTLKEAFEKSLSSMQTILRRTYKHATDCTQPGEKIDPKLLEMQVIKNREVIEDPDVKLVAVPLY